MVDVFGTVSSSLSIDLPQVRGNLFHKSTFPRIYVVAGRSCSDLWGESHSSRFMSLITIVLVFQIYSVYAVLSGVISVNDCPEASKELTEEIADARKDLISKGFKFRD